MSSTLAPPAFEANPDDKASLSVVSSEAPFSSTATLSATVALGSKSVWKAWVICPEAVPGAGGIVGVVGDVGARWSVTWATSAPSSAARRCPSPARWR